MFQASTFAESSAGELYIVKYGEPSMIYQLPCPDCASIAVDIGNANDPEPIVPPPTSVPLLPAPSGTFTVLQRLLTYLICLLCENA
jgi:hypothetical protein